MRDGRRVDVDEGTDGALLRCVSDADVFPFFSDSDENRAFIILLFGLWLNEEKFEYMQGPNCKSKSSLYLVLVKCRRFRFGDALLLSGFQVLEI